MRDERKTTGSELKDGVIITGNKKDEKQTREETIRRESRRRKNNREEKRKKTNKESGISWNSENDHWRRKEEHQIDLD